MATQAAGNTPPLPHTARVAYYAAHYTPRGRFWEEKFQAGTGYFGNAADSHVVSDEGGQSLRCDYPDRLQSKVRQEAHRLRVPDVEPGQEWAGG